MVAYSAPSAASHEADGEDPDDELWEDFIHTIFITRGDPLPQLMEEGWMDDLGNEANIEDLFDELCLCLQRHGEWSWPSIPRMGGKTRGDCKGNMTPASTRPTALTPGTLQRHG